MSKYNLKSRKRKDRDIIDTNDLDDDNPDDEIKPLKNITGHLNSKYKDKLQLIKNKIKERDIGYEEIMDLDLPEDELIWFIEHIQILRNTMKHTEDHYRIKNMIYNKYKNLEENFARNAKNKEILCRLKELRFIQNDILSRICESKQSDYIKGILYKKYMLLNGMDKSDEYFKIFDWIDTVLDLPTEIKIPLQNYSINSILVKLKDNLNSKIFGLYNVKEKIIEAYCAMLTNPNYKKKNIALVGPPGVGKTALGKAIADTFEQLFSQISFGTIKDSNILTGFSLTYIGSRPGEFVNILRRSKVLNTVVLLDEIDKIPNSIEGQSISSVLLHVLDKTQNDHFQDMYMPEIPIDLSNIFFILAMNDDKIIDPILKDRLYIINIDGYTLDEKIIIGTKYIFPKIISNLKFKGNDIILKDRVMKYIINKNKKDTESEKGVRKLERDISTICEKLNVLKNTSLAKKRLKLSYSIDGLKFPLCITKEIVDVLLD